MNCSDTNLCAQCTLGKKAFLGSFTVGVPCNISQSANGSDYRESVLIEKVFNFLHRHFFLVIST